MRKHPDVVAIVFLGFVLLAGSGMRSVKQRVQAERFRVHQLGTREVLHEVRGGLKETREGILEFKNEFKDALRQSIRDTRPAFRRP